MSKREDPAGEEAGHIYSYEDCACELCLYAREGSKACTLPECVCQQERDQAYVREMLVKNGAEYVNALIESAAQQ